jgi:two-component system, chemotaxis family, CheB/CheR fusion protein
VTDSPTPDGFEELLQYLKRSRGFDFTGYKRASLQRRVDKRMQSVGVSDYVAYVDYLEVHQPEFVALFNTILINVTSFFRDAPTWQYLRSDVIPAHLDRVPPDRPIRVWSAGCASGEEAYSIAMLLAEQLGDTDFRRRVKIYGTDVDEDALQTARQGVYSASSVDDVPRDLRERYFEAVNDRFAFRADLRRALIFGRLDLLRDAPISRLELLLCRNTLMYFNAETQGQVLERFHFALNERGILVLGKAETLLSHSPLFEPIDRKRRVFSRASPLTLRDRMPRIPVTDADMAAPVTLESAALDSVPAAAIIVDRDGSIVRTNSRARSYFGLRAADHGRPLQDVEVSYRPIDLRTPINQVHETGRAVHITDVEWTIDGESRSLDVDVVPLVVDSTIAGVSCLFVDMTVQRDLQAQLRQTNHELEQAYEEVQSTNEELETTNEELQSTIEELETTNEELQSTNEELETMNEELQSTNDELHAVNEEVRVRGDEVAQLNQFLEAILASLRGGVVVVDRDRRVRVWNAQAEELWGLRSEEVRDLDLLDLDIGLPVKQLDGALNGAITSGTGPDEVTLDAVTRRGRSVTCRVAITPLREGTALAGAILVMDAQPVA